MTPFDHLLHHRPQTPYETWLCEKRAEVIRCDRDGHRKWIQQGCFPQVKYGATK